MARPYGRPCREGRESLPDPVPGRPTPHGLPPSSWSALGGRVGGRVVHVPKLADKPAPDVGVPSEIYYLGRRVITLSGVDGLHRRPRGTAKRAFRDRGASLRRGADGHRLAPSEARQLLGERPSNLGGVTVLTESGHAALAAEMGVAPEAARAAWHGALAADPPEGATLWEAMARRLRCLLRPARQPDRPAPAEAPAVAEPAPSDGAPMPPLLGDGTRWLASMEPDGRMIFAPVLPGAVVGSPAGIAAAIRAGGWAPDAVRAVHAATVDYLAVRAARSPDVQAIRAQAAGRSW